MRGKRGAERVLVQGSSHHVDTGGGEASTTHRAVPIWSTAVTLAEDEGEPSDAVQIDVRPLHGRTHTC